MKYISVAVLMLCATQVNAIKFFDMPSEENAEIITEANKMNKDDTDIMKTIDEKIAQAQRNSQQGEIGRTLAMNKVNEIKIGLSQIESNFEKETTHAISNGLSEEVAMYNLQKKQSNLAELEKKAKIVSKRIPMV